MHGLITRLHPDTPKSEYEEYQWVSFPYLESSRRTKNSPASGEFVPCYEHELSATRGVSRQAKAVSRNMDKVPAGVYVAVVGEEWQDESEESLLNLFSEIRAALPNQHSFGVMYADGLLPTLVFGTCSIPSVVLLAEGWNETAQYAAELVPLSLFDISLEKEEVDESPVSE